MSVQEIKNEMIAIKENEDALIDLNSTSKVSIWNLMLFIVASCFQDLLVYFNAHREYVDGRLINEKYGTLPWYRQKALDFLFGFDLIQDTDQFNTNGVSEEDIEAAKIIKYAAVNEGESYGIVVVKIATEENGVLSPLSSEAEISVEEYFEEIKIAGTRISVINFLADKLFLTMNIQIDPLVFNLDGVHKLNGNKPVEDEIYKFLKDLPFNGELVLQDLEIHIRGIEGVEIAEVIEARSSWLDPEAGTHGDPTVFNTKRIPESGYFEVVNFDNLVYVV